MVRARGSILAVVIAALFMACGEAAQPRPEVGVEDAWIRAVAGPDANTAAYMTLRNTGGALDRLIGARSAVSRMTELHRTTIDEAGLARMGKVEALDLPAGGAAVLEPGGYHLMLMGVGALAEGDTVRLVLDFERIGTVDVAAEVRPY